MSAPFDDELGLLSERLLQQIRVAEPVDSPLMRIGEAVAALSAQRGGLMSFGALERAGRASGFVFIFADGSTARLGLDATGAIESDEVIVGVTHTAQATEYAAIQACDAATCGADGAQ